VDLARLGPKNDEWKNDISYHDVEQFLYTPYTLLSYGRLGQREERKKVRNSNRKGFEHQRCVYPRPLELNLHGCGMRSVYDTRGQIWIGGCSLTEATHADESATREGRRTWRVYRSGGKWQIRKSGDKNGAL
jgi:hypothetical protein